MTEFRGWEDPRLAGVSKKYFQNFDTQRPLLSQSATLYVALKDNLVSRVHLWRLENHERVLRQKYQDWPRDKAIPASADPEQKTYVEVLVKLLKFLHDRREAGREGAEEALAAVKTSLSHGSDKAAYIKVLKTDWCQPSAYRGIHAIVAALDALADSGPAGLDSARKFCRRIAKGAGGPSL